MTPSILAEFGSVLSVGRLPPMSVNSSVCRRAGHPLLLDRRQISTQLQLAKPQAEWIEVGLRRALSQRSTDRHAPTRRPNCSRAHGRRRWLPQPPIRHRLATMYSNVTFARATSCSSAPKSVAGVLLLNEPRVSLAKRLSSGVERTAARVRQVVPGQVGTARPTSLEALGWCAQCWACCVITTQAFT